MRLPVVAIVGRPNVGKSTLFNRLAGRRISIVEDVPGVTRDRLYAEAVHEDVRFTLIDTGGFEPDPETKLAAAIREQTRLAIEEADVIVLVTDARAGEVPADTEVARMLRKSGRPMLVAANKADGPKQEHDAATFYALGVDQVCSISAEHGLGIYDMLDSILAKMPEELRDAGEAAQAEIEREYYEDEEAIDEALAEFELVDDERDPEQPRVNPEDDAIEAPSAKDSGRGLELQMPEVLRICVIGKPNAGKSSLINKLLGEERHLVSDLPGTTMDSVDSFFEHGGQRFRLIDTAGIRRKRSISQQMEKYAVVSALKGMDRADIALFLIDATEGLTEQDLKVAAFAHDKGKGMIICVNKWDLRQELELDAKQFTDNFRERVPFLAYAPIKFISAKTGRRVFELLDQTVRVAESYFTRVPTSDVNRVIQACMRDHPPPVHRGKRVKLYYAAQVKVAPPIFVVATNNPEGVHFSYQRFVTNRLRETFAFEGAPIKVLFRQKGTPKGRAQNMEARKRALAGAKRRAANLKAKKARGPRR